MDHSVKRLSKLWPSRKTRQNAAWADTTKPIPNDTKGIFAGRKIA